MLAKVIRIIDANLNPGLCGPCGGKCCQATPGAMFPDDVDTSTDPAALGPMVRAMLQSGRYTLDHFAGNPFEYHERPNVSVSAYFLRPAVKGSEGRWVDQSWGLGACTFHTEAGCSLSADARPSECRALVPAPGSRCSKSPEWEGRRTAAKAWWPYRELLQALCDEDSWRD